MITTGSGNIAIAEIQHYYRDYYMNGTMKLKEVSKMIGICKYKIMRNVEVTSINPYDSNDLYNQRMDEALSKTNYKTLKHLNSLNENIN